MVCNIDDPTRLAFPCGVAWYGAGAPWCAEAGQELLLGSHHCSTALFESTLAAIGVLTCGCSSAATRWRCTAS